MASRADSLDSLRRDIDGIDDQMHELLMRRAEVVERIGAIKSKEAARVHIPAREAAILRRLVERHRDRLPAPVVVRIWRELFAAAALLQGPFTVAVHAPEDSVAYWDLARDHYGSCTRMSLHKTANPVIRAVVDGAATVAVLPFPEDGDPDPWWRLLVGAGGRTPRVVARLPFIDNQRGGSRRFGALSIARMDQEETGDDVSFLVVEADSDLSRGGLKRALTAARLPATDVAVWHDEKNPKSRLHLIEIAGFVGREDTRMAAAMTEAGGSIGRVTGIGGYARPLGRRDGPGDG